MTLDIGNRCKASGGDVEAQVSVVDCARPAFQGICPIRREC